jgi:hypothetical protein
MSGKKSPGTSAVSESTSSGTDRLGTPTGLDSSPLAEVPAASFDGRACRPLGMPFDDSYRSQCQVVERRSGDSA